MAQHDYDIANDTAANVRADLNNVLAAIVSNNSGASAPPTTYANQWWYDSANNILKIRDESDTAWIDFATLDQSNSVWKFPTDATPDTDSTHDLGESSLKWATLYVDNVSDGTKTVGAEYILNGSAKAWVLGDGTGTVNIRGSFNVSSITDNGTGNYSFSFTNNFASVTDMAPLAGASGRISSSNTAMPRPSSHALSSVTVRTYNGSNNPGDAEEPIAHVTGDLA